MLRATPTSAAMRFVPRPASGSSRSCQTTPGSTIDTYASRGATSFVESINSFDPSPERDAARFSVAMYQCY